MNLDIGFYWKLFLRRFPVMALLFTLCAGLGVFTALRTPEYFNTAARLLVEEPQIPSSMVASTVNTNATEQLDIIEQQLLTRANLIDIANQFEVYTDLSTAEPDTIVERMKEDTRIRRSAGRGEATLMTISFEGRNGQVVADVVNQYVTVVLETNSEFRMSRTGNTLDFFEQEVTRLGQELDERSVAISVFKTENATALPEDQSFRLGRQALLQERMATLDRDLRATENQRRDIEQIFESTGSVGNNQQQQAMSPEEQQLIVARTDLELALETYSEQNPRVTRQRSVVERLEAIVASQSIVAEQLQSSGEQVITPEEAIFHATMAEIENRFESLTSEIERTQIELEQNQADISASTINAIQLSALERDFSAVQARYNAAVDNLNAAQMSERMEVTSQGQRITVIENANIPQIPSGPNRPKTVVLTSALGLGLAGAFFVLLELLNRNIRRPAELLSRFEITPIATIPYMESRQRRLIRRFSLIVATLIALIGVPLALWYLDQNYMPLNLVMDKVLSRLSLG